MGITLTWSVFAAGASAASGNPPETAALHFGGCGGVYFLAEPGEFWVEIEKYDLNKSGRKTFLRAILTGPDRSIAREEYLPDDGQAKGSGPGPIQRARLSASVPRKGVYALNITVTEDRYGEDIAWGFHTNAQRYLIETSRGHRDAPHEEPLVLLTPDAPGDVCFMPERGAFSIDLSGLAVSASPPMLYDAADQLVAAMTPSAEGAAHYTVPADPARIPRPWRLHLSSFQAVVQIDGVTRWPEKSDYPGLSLWSPHADSWFPFHENRWPLLPYQKTLYGESGAQGRVAFTVYNNAFESRTFLLSLEFPETPWNAALSLSEVAVPPRQEARVDMTCAVPETGDAWKCHIRVTPQDAPDFSTYSTVLLRRGIAPAARPLPIPLTLKPYAHENEQFGYCPDYPLTDEAYFDMNGQPFICSETGIFHRQDGDWRQVCEAAAPDGQSIPIRIRSSKVAFDQENDVYALGDIADGAALLYSRDGGITFKTCPIPGHGTLDIEQFSGHNAPGGPPPVVRYTLTATDPKLFWRRLNDLDLLLPENASDNAVRIGDPIPISKKCIGFSAHSGIPSSVVSRDGKTHVAWAEATESQEKAEGVPTFVVTYDRNAKTLGTPALVGYGPPANDVHNTPSITMDSQGYLHVLIGTHGRTFRYARSLQPNDAGGGWSEPEEVAPGLRQTYVGLVCDKEDTLHLVFRLWFDDGACFPTGIYAALAHMTKRPGEPWSKAQPIILPAFSEYSVYYHRLTLDRAGRLFLSYDYWSTFWFYRTDHHGSRRAMMMSPDGGATWQLANNEFWKP